MRRPKVNKAAHKAALGTGRKTDRKAISFGTYQLPSTGMADWLHHARVRSEGGIYRGTCQCPWRGEFRNTYADALRDADEHRANHNQ